MLGGNCDKTIPSCKWILLDKEDYIFTVNISHSIYEKKITTFNNYKCNGALRLSVIVRALGEWYVDFIKRKVIP